MQQRRLKDQDQDEEDEEKEKRSRKKASELRIHDLEDDLEMSSDDSEASGEEGGRAPKPRRRHRPAREAGRRRRRRAQMMRPLRTVMTGTLRARRWTTCPMAPAAPRMSWKASPRPPSRRRAPRAWMSRGEQRRE